MEYLAHSAKGAISAQSYTEHVDNVRRLAVQNACSASEYYSGDHDLLSVFSDLCAYYHDLGKLETENQKVLHGDISRAALPINHVDAGSAALKKLFPENYLPASIVYSHHKGLPNYPEESTRKNNCFRDDKNEIRHHTDDNLSGLLRIHQSLITQNKGEHKLQSIMTDPGVFIRILLSCLADADHSDTARNYGKYPEKSDIPLLRPDERLKKLDEYVGKFGSTDDERNQLRSEMYAACRNSELKNAVSACDSPVGSGKTTSVMAHLLKQAIRRRSRRIFVVLPFTNIISQSVDVCRKALVLPGEDPEEVVAELHCRADFESEETRILTAQWRAPVIVTTAVAFFETIASNRPSSLRRLHELPGSVIFVDEAHAALPVRLLPLAWKWMQSFADEWGCYWVLASGSLAEFWKIDEIAKKPRDVPQIVNKELRDRLNDYENRRIDFLQIIPPISRDDLIKRITDSPGPRLLIMNTVQSAAVMAKDLLQYYGQKDGISARVFHLSASLTAEDRRKTIGEIKKRLADKNDLDWVLVATSCVEAGVDFSFHTGFREVSSLMSLLQASGRINRNGEYPDSRIWSFSMQDDRMLAKNPAVKDSAYVLSRFFQRNEKISAALCTRAICDELNRNSISDFVKMLEQAENSMMFKNVADDFVIIENDTVPVVVDEELKNKIRNGNGSWKDIQKKAVMVRRRLVDQLNLSEIAKDIYDWDLPYSEFLGTMEGVLDFLAKID